MENLGLISFSKVLIYKVIVSELLQRAVIVLDNLVAIVNRKTRYVVVDNIGEPICIIRCNP